MQKRKKIAFTLIELLVVISIISLLMAILMPALAEMRKKARSLLCLTRLNSLGKLAYVYTSSNEGLFWPGYGWKTGGNSGTNLCDKTNTWYYILGQLGSGSKESKAFVKDWKPRCCPIAEKPNRQLGQLTPGGKNTQPDEALYAAWGAFPPNTNNTWEEPNVFGSYGDNAWICSMPNKADGYGYSNWWSITSVPSGSTVFANSPMRKFNWQNMNVKNGDQIPMLFDCAWISAAPDNNNITPESETWCHNAATLNPNFNLTEEMRSVCLNRHNQGTNIVYVDGHAANVALKQLWWQRWRKNAIMDGSLAPLGVNNPQNKAIPKTQQWISRYRKD